jgi:SPP1 family predicted phage head-tail adaptor
VIGNFNRKIDFYRDSGAVDEANEPVVDPWVFHKSRWAQIKGETGMGSIRAAASAGGVNTPLDRYSFRINYDTSIKVGMQIRERDGTRYNIVSVRHDKADRDWTDVVGETGGANG